MTSVIPGKQVHSMNRVKWNSQKYVSNKSWSINIRKNLRGFYHRSREDEWKKSTFLNYNYPDYVKYFMFINKRLNEASLYDIKFIS